jgi:hypothetical protein
MAIGHRRLVLDGREHDGTLILAGWCQKSHRDCNDIGVRSFILSGAPKNANYLIDFINIF